MPTSAPTPGGLGSAGLRPLARRRGGAREATVGFVLVGGSAFILLGLGPRLLGAAAFSGVGIIWTVSTVFGVGVATPIEQVINRRMNSRSPHAIRTPLLTLLAMAAVAALVCIGFIGRLPSSSALPATLAGCLLAVVGWVLTAAVRGRLAGSGDLVGYSVVLGTEAGTRLVLAALAVLLRSHSDVLLPAAVGAPLVVAALVGLRWRIPAVDDEATSSAPVRWEQLAFVLVALGFQGCVNLAALLIEARVGATQPGATGQFVAASTYFRVPLLLTGGVLTSALVVLSTAWVDRDLTRFHRSLRRSTWQVGLLTTVPSLVLLLLAPVLLPVYYGSDLDLPWVLLLGLASSTILAALGAALTQSLLATGRSVWAGLVWIVSAAVTVVALLATPSLGPSTAFALMIGPALASGVLFWTAGAVERSMRREVAQ